MEDKDSEETARFERLRRKYQDFLFAYGLCPREPGHEQEALRTRLAAMRSANRTEGDRLLGRWSKELEEKIRSGQTLIPKDPVGHFFRALVCEIETSIEAHPADRAAFRRNVYTGEFPTGSVNAEAVYIDGDYLALINTGSLVLFQQMAEFLCNGDPELPLEDANNQLAVNGMISVLVSYLTYGDPIHGPRPMSGGFKAFLTYAMSRACIKFMLAHEYGHILCGHLDRNKQLGSRVKLPQFDIDVVKNSWKEELEADVWAYKTTLGINHLEDDLDCSIIDKAIDIDAKSTAGDFRAALALKCAIAAPFWFLTIDLIVARITERFPGSELPVGTTTHPPAQLRMQQLAVVLARNLSYGSYVNYVGLLSKSLEFICSEVRARMTSPTTLP